MNSKLRYIVVYLFIVTLVVTGISFSRFTTTVTNTGAHNTVPPDIEFTVWAMDYAATPVSLEGMMPGGPSRQIDIEIKNWKHGDDGPIISGYNQRVNLELETTGNLPLHFTLNEKFGDEVHLARYGPTLYKSDNIEFIADEPSTPIKKEYILTVAWPDDDDFKAEKYKDEIDYIELRLKAAQSQ